MKRQRKPYRWYKFWIKSNRGTDSISYKMLPREYDKEDVKAELECWCEGFGAWHHGENYVRYGAESVRRPPKKWLRSKLAGMQDAIKTKQEQIDFIEKELGQWQS